MRTSGDMAALVKDPSWQKLRKSLVGTWKSNAADNVKQLRSWLGPIKKATDAQLKIIVNYLTGTGFRLKVIQHPAIDKLKAEVQKQQQSRLGLSDDQGSDMTRLKDRIAKLETRVAVGLSDHETWTLQKLYEYLREPDADELESRGFEEGDKDAYWFIVQDQFLAPEGLPQTIEAAKNLVKQLIQKGFLTKKDMLSKPGRNPQEATFVVFTQTGWKYLTNRSARTRIARNPNLLRQYFTEALGLNMVLHYAHWFSKAQAQYGDHLLYSRLYGDIEAEIDQIAEKSIGLTNEESIDQAETLVVAANWALKFSIDPKMRPSQIAGQALKAEQAYLQTMESIYQQLKDSNQITLGLDDLIMSHCSKHEEHVYLLKQRTALENKASLV